MNKKELNTHINNIEHAIIMDRVYKKLKKLYKKGKYKKINTDVTSIYEKIYNKYHEKITSFDYDFWNHEHPNSYKTDKKKSEEILYFCKKKLRKEI